MFPFGDGRQLPPPNTGNFPPSEPGGGLPPGGDPGGGFDKVILSPYNPGDKEDEQRLTLPSVQDIDDFSHVRFNTELDENDIEYYSYRRARDLIE
jgi:hypothetical protein